MPISVKAATRAVTASKRGGYMRRAWLLACALSVISSQVLAQSEAPVAITGAVMVVLGSSEGSGVDPAIAKLEALQKAPFDSFPKKTLLSNTNVALTLGKETEIELPNGRKLRLVVLEKTSDGRFRVTLSINRNGKQDYLPLMTVVATPGDPFFVAGQKHQGGTLIIGITVGKTTSAAGKPG